VRFGIIRGFVRRLAECVMGPGRRAQATSLRQFERRRQQSVGGPRVPDPLSRPLGTLRPVGPKDQRPASARERRRRVGARPLQDRGRPGPTTPRQSRFRQPRGVCGLPEATYFDAERRPSRSRRRRAAGVARLARFPSVVVPEGALPGRFGQLDSHPSQHLLRPQSTARRNH
jgi:hypothetical protein